MAPSSRTSFPSRLVTYHTNTDGFGCSNYTDQRDHDYNPKTQLRSPTDNNDIANCHPWDSRGRRLFPQRRTSILTSVSHNSNVPPCFSPFESSPLNVHSPVDREGFDSRISSPSSVGSVVTVQVHKSPNTHWPSPETDSRSGQDAHVRMPFSPRSLRVSSSVEREITPHRPMDKSSRINFSNTLYADAPARSKLQWKSLAHFHRSRRRQSPRVLLQLPNSENASCDSGQSYDGRLPINDPFKGSLAFEAGPFQRSQSPKPTAHPGLSPIEVHQNSGRDEGAHLVTQDSSLTNVPALEIATWDCAVKMSTVTTVAGNGKLHVHHLALLSIIMPMEAVYTEKISLCLMISNGLRTDHKCSLGLGQSSVFFSEDVSKSGFFPREGAELVIVRDSCDLMKPINLYFSFTYAFPWDSVMASLPTFRPKNGRSISEVVFIAEPQPPLKMTTYTRDPLSSWRLCQHPVGQVTCYERINFPEPHPARFQDKIQMKFLELEPVRFRTLGESTHSKVIWKLDITVHEPPGEQIECRMSFFVEVGAVSALVTLIPHGWVPRYFILDGCVATEKGGECWKNKDGYITIFKQAYMGRGPIMVETYWQRPPKNGGCDVGGRNDLTLPSVADRKVLGGRLTCLADTVILLNHLGDRFRPYGPVDGDRTLFPTMDTGYKILLKCTTEARAQKLRRRVVVRRPSLPIIEDTQLSEHSLMSPDVEVKRGHGTALSHTANNANGVAAPPKHSLQFVVFTLLTLLLLVPGFLLSVEHVPKGNGDNERVSWKRVSSRDRERREAMIDVAESDSLQPAVVAAVDTHVGVAKCEGWRDWIDYGSGWKGCVP